MAAQAGKDILIKIDTGGGVFASAAGLRSKTISLNAQPVDVTNADSIGQWREILAGAGVVSMSVSGSGVFTDAATDEDMRAALVNRTTPDFQVIVPAFGTFQGPFAVTSIEYAGEHDGEATYSLSLESAGEITFTAA